MIGHPSERRLLGFLDGGRADGDRQRIARHLAGCQRCRDVVQGHRTVRAALRLEPSPAPGGVLGRILDTRDAGGLVVLPVADPGGGHSRRPGPMALIVSAAAVLVIAMVQFVPVTPFHAAWQWWSRTVAEFGARPSGSRPLIDGPLWPVPVAKPAVLHPEKLRPMTVRYRRVVSYDGRRPPKVDSTLGFSLDHAAKSAGWRINPSSDPADVTELDARTGSVRSWTYETLRQPRYSIISQMEIRDRWLYRDVEYHGTPFPRLAAALPEGLDSVIVPTRAVPPFTLGTYDRTVQLMAAPLHDGWSGSFTDLNTDPLRIFNFLRSFSYLVDGADKVRTPAGIFEAWRVKQFSDYGEYPQILWLRKSDGLMIKTECPDNPCGVMELLSVSYP